MISLLRRVAEPDFDIRGCNRGEPECIVIDRQGAAPDNDAAVRPLLFFFLRTGDADLLLNSGENPTAPFKTGGAFDIMLGANPKAAKANAR